MAKASLLMSPAGFKATKLYSVVPNTGVGDFTVARASTATRVNSVGLIETMASDVPLLDYSDASLLEFGTIDACPVLLTQPQSTNNIIYSEDFSQANWQKLDSSSVLTTNVSPSGVSSSSRLTEGVGTSRHRFNHSLISIVNGNDYVFSVFAKADSRQHLTIINTVKISGFVMDVTSTFNLSDGTVQSGSGKITSMVNGWYRCEQSFTAEESVTTNFICQILLNNGSGIDYTGDGVSGVLVWGAQFEQQPSRTSYIKTSGVIATRLKDQLSGAGDVSLFNSEEGVLYAEIAPLSNDATEKAISINDGTAANRMYISYSNTSEIFCRFIVGGANQATLISTGHTTTAFNKIAIQWALNSFSLCVNGVEVATDNSGLVPPSNSLSQVNFDSDSAGGNSFFGKSKNIQVYDTSLTLQQRIDLTTP